LTGFYFSADTFFILFYLFIALGVGFKVLGWEAGWLP